MTEPTDPPRDQESFWKGRCSFCGKDPGRVRKIFSGFHALICDECVRTCYGLLAESETAAPADEISREDLPRPQAIKSYLDEYTIGQETAKRTVSVAVYNHYKRVFYPEWQESIELEKSNILLLGPTGTGKTLMARTLARKQA